MGAEQNSFLFGANSTFIEELYARYLERPASVDASWQQFFASLTEDQHAVLLESRGASWAPRRTQVIGAGEATPLVKAPGATAEKSVTIAGFADLRRSSSKTQV